MSKMQYSVSDEQDLMSDLWSPQIKDNPLAFVLHVFPWGVKGTPLENFKGPRVWQREALLRITEHIEENAKKGNGVPFDVLRHAVSSGRGIGKSALVSWIILWMLSTRIGSTVIVSANTENQLKSVTWAELVKWMSMSIHAHWFDVSATKMVPQKWLSNLVEKQLKKGTRYWAVEGKVWSEENPDGYAGVHNMDGMMVIFDEASGIPDSIWSVAAGFFTEDIPDRYWLAFSNPRRNTGYFFDAVEGSKRDFWTSRKINALHVEGTDKNLYHQIIKEYGDDSMEARVEVKGEFPKQGEDQFIALADVEEAMMRASAPLPNTPVIMGVDPSGKGEDFSAVVVRKGPNILAIKRFKCESSTETVDTIIDMIEEFKPNMTCMDEGGVGYAMVGEIKSRGYQIRAVDFGWASTQPKAYANKRAEMWDAMRTWIKSATLPPDNILKSDLTGPKRKIDSKATGRILLESKREMKARNLASPDLADALALTFAFKLNHQVLTGPREVRRVTTRLRRFR